jgi:hypothetical protein
LPDPISFTDAVTKPSINHMLDSIDLDAKGRRSNIPLAKKPPISEIGTPHNFLYSKQGKIVPAQAILVPPVS